MSLLISLTRALRDALHQEGQAGIPGLKPIAYWILSPFCLVTSVKISGLLHNKLVPASRYKVSLELILQSFELPSLLCQRQIDPLNHKIEMFTRSTNWLSFTWLSLKTKILW